MDELGVDALEPAGVALLDELGVLAVERAALAPGQRGVEDVADDPAREGQAVAAGLALLLEHALADEAVDVVVEVPVVLGDLLEVLRVEGLPEHGRDREQVAQLLREPLDALLDGLLDRRGQGVGRDLGLLREAPGPGVVLRDAARLDERADELPGEEGVALGRVPQPPGELVGDLRGADERLDERAVLGGGEGRQRDRDEARVVREGLEHADEGMPLVGLGLPVAADDQRRRGPQAPDDVLQGLDRDLRAVQVVEDEDEGLAAGDPRQGPGDELEDLDPVLGLLLLGRRPRCGNRR